jgi:hypothetical protein
MIYFLVEGSDDRRFIDRIIVPLLDMDRSEIEFYEYASKTTKEVNSFLRALDAMHTKYIFTADKDCHVCISRKKDSLKLRFSSLIDDHISIVDREIESWIVSGATDRACRVLGLKQQLPCEAFSKERFEALLCKTHPTTVALFNEVLQDFALEAALGRSASLAYFLSRKLGYVC